MKKPLSETQQTSRRSILKSLAGLAAIAPLEASALDMPATSVSEPEILPLFDAIPGEKAVSIFAPAFNGRPQLSVQMNVDKRMFVGSAIKTFVLAEALRQADSPDVVATLKAKQLALDASGMEQ